MAAYADPNGNLKIADVSWHQLGDGAHDVSDDELIARAKAWFLASGSLKQSEALSATYQVEEGG